MSEHSLRAAASPEAERTQQSEHSLRATAEPEAERTQKSEHSLRVAIVGAGILGRLTALELAARGAEVTLLERGPACGTTSTAAIAAGMLAPYCELENADLQVHRLGLASLALWRSRLAEFDEPVYFQNAGSLVVAHARDRAELERLKRFVCRAPGEPGFRAVAGLELSELEPELDARFVSGLYFPHEGQIDSRGFLAASVGALAKRGVRAVFDREIANVSALLADFDRVIDTRGIHARKDLRTLRGVRGEVIRVHAPGVELRRPVRLMHPRFPIYVVPRPGNIFVIGATQIESEDESPVSVRSALELLSAVFALNPAFSEARILEMQSGLRPAFPDHLPRLLVRDRLIQANGLFRHGFLVAPKVAELLGDLVLGLEPDAEFRELYGKNADDTDREND